VQEHAALEEAKPHPPSSLRNRFERTTSLRCMHTENHAASNRRNASTSAATGKASKRDRSGYVLGSQIKAWPMQEEKLCGYGMQT
jgi:hypothetical protein